MQKILQLESLQILDLHRKACETKILQALRVSGPSSWGTPQAMVYRKRTIMKIANFTLIKVLNKTQKTGIHKSLVRAFFCVFCSSEAILRQKSIFRQIRSLETLDIVPGRLCSPFRNREKIFFGAKRSQCGANLLKKGLKWFKME